ncbi:MAG: non-homologous end-joining DNA ligase [Limnochordaceae bacterium]|nr:non-homologous end-joining DNA ligase [Limnochordaceae bacterium]
MNEIFPTCLPAQFEVMVGGRQLRLTHCDRVLWPDAGFTKADLILYYLSVAEELLPHLRDRLVTVTRYPDGVDHPGFYQKHLPEYAPDWLGRIRIASEEAERGYIDYPDIREPAALIWFANQAAIELHPSLNRVDRPGHPDYAIFDLDPNPPANLATAREVALRLRDLLVRLGLRSYPKLTGATGLHIYVPLEPIYSFDITSQFVAYLGELLVHHRPDQVTNERLVARRGGRVYIDHLQNRPSKTIVAVLSVRPLTSAPLSLPITWDELEAGLPGPFTLADRAEAQRRAALFRPVLQGGQRLDALLPVLQERLASSRA